jgi:hypothetical protein
LNLSVIFGSSIVFYICVLVFSLRILDVKSACRTQAIMKVYPSITYPPKRTCLSLILLCLALTILDIAVVETQYRPLQAWDRIWVWHRIYGAIWMLAPVLCAAVLRSLVPWATWFFFVFGLEDTMFYALQGYLPPRYWGVSIFSLWEPPLNFVLLVNIIGLATILLFTFAGPDRAYNSFKARASSFKM